MKIMDLVPTERIGLQRVNRFAEHLHGWKDALPEALPDDLLLQIPDGHPNSPTDGHPKFPHPGVASLTR